MEFKDLFKLACIRCAIYNVNVRSEPWPNRPIPHFTPSTYTLLTHFRSKTPKNPKYKHRLQKEDGTYFTDQEEEKYYYELEQYCDCMREQEDKEREEREREYRDDDAMDIPDTWRFSK